MAQNKQNKTTDSKRVWRNDAGDALECWEKIKVLEENHAELVALLQDCLADGTALGVSDRCMRESFRIALESLV